MHQNCNLNLIPPKRIPKNKLNGKDFPYLHDTIAPESLVAKRSTQSELNRHHYIRWPKTSVIILKWPKMTCISTCTPTSHHTPMKNVPTFVDYQHFSPWSMTNRGWHRSWRFWQSLFCTAEVTQTLVSKNTLIMGRCNPRLWGRNLIMKNWRKELRKG